MTTATLLRAITRHYRAHKRDFPWRRTRDPYRILVSEIMLQQTQTARVVPFYNHFMKQFPTARALADAPLSKVLAAWQGLGYNRRAKYLKQAAEIIARDGFRGQKLPGVGPYTAGAVAAFAFNKQKVFIETNIRTVFIHFFFPTQVGITDTDILPFVERALQKTKLSPRDFYWALMDYGAFLKGSGVKLNSRSKHYVKQSKFEGSARQLRGALIRALLQQQATKTALIKKFSPAWSRGEIERELFRLQSEGLVALQARRYRVA